jgi:hypothetical protein
VTVYELVCEVTVCDLRIETTADTYYYQQFSGAVLESLLIMDISNGSRTATAADNLRLLIATHLQ